MVVLICNEILMIVITDYGTKHEFQYIKTMAYSCNHSGKNLRQTDKFKGMIL